MVRMLFLLTIFTHPFNFIFALEIHTLSRPKIIVSLEILELVLITVERVST